MTFPGADLPLLDYITLYWPYMMHATLNMRSVDVEVRPGMGFLWPTKDFKHILSRSEVNLGLYQDILTIAHVPYTVVDGYRVAMTENLLFMDLSDKTIEKKYRACIFPGKELSRSTWCQLLSSFGPDDEVVIVDESSFNPEAEGFDVPAVDMRGMDMTLTLDIIRQSDVVVGPSSGIVAMATYAGVPFVTYGGYENNPWKDQLNYNPFETFGMSFRGVPSDTQLEEAVHFALAVQEERSEKEASEEEEESSYGSEEGGEEDWEEGDNGS